MPQVTHLRRVISCCSEDDRDYIAGVVGALQQATLSVPNTELLLECALYFESIGDLSNALHIAEDALGIASSLNDINLQRRSHSIVGVILSRQCDFARAMMHLEVALSIARSMCSPLYECAVLCNIAATLPYMGLMQDAKNLSVKILSFQNGSPDFDQLHLQNALNGIRLSQSLSDHSSLVTFNRVADKLIAQVPSISALTRAYYDAYHAFGLLLQEMPSEAYAYVHAKIQFSKIENIRATSTLMVARGICAVKTKSQRYVREAYAGLAEILPALKRTPFHYEEALRALVSLSKADSRKSSRTKGLLLARELSDHVINVKHRQFFDRLPQEHRLKQAVELSAPKYYISTQILPKAGLESGSDCAANEGPQVVEATHLDRVRQWTGQYGDSSRLSIEKKLRSKEYDIAEEWALSADYFADRCGNHCMEVGALAWLIALELGKGALEACTLDLACRLHDIGKVLVDGTIQRNVKLGAVDDYLVMREHTQMGAALLGRLDDPLLALSAKVARSHHEWWNGCGHPDAIAGEEIPLAARICAAADNYLILLRPSNNRLQWSKDCAVQQIKSMSGVQLDPSIVMALVAAVEKRQDADHMVTSMSSESRSVFLKSRKSLIDVIA